MQVWSYWDGPMPAVYEAMLETVRWHNPGLRVLGKTDAQEELDRQGWSIDLGRLAPNHASDVIRFALLLEHGGIWVDADTICFRPLDWLTPLAEQFGLVVTKAWWHVTSPATAVMASTAGGSLLEATRDCITTWISSGKKLSWSALGPLALRQAIHRHRRHAPVCVVQGPKVAPLNWSSKPDSQKLRGRLCEPVRARLRCVDPHCQILTHEIVSPFQALTDEELRSDERAVPEMIRESRVEHRRRWLA